MQKTAPISSSSMQRQHDVADPLLNEAAILNDLDRVSSAPSAAQLKQGARLAILDTFDRRPYREPFAELVCEACSLQANLSRLEFAETLRKALEGGKLDKAMLDETIKGLTNVCEERRAGLIKLFKPVTEMRLEGDPLH